MTYKVYHKVLWDDGDNVDDDVANLVDSGVTWSEDDTGITLNGAMVSSDNLDVLINLLTARDLHPVVDAE